MFGPPPPSSCPHLPEKSHHNLKRRKDDRVWAVYSKELKVLILLFFYHLFTMVNNIRITRSQVFSCQIHSLNVGCHWSLIVTLCISLVIEQKINIIQHHTVTIQWDRKALICRYIMWDCECIFALRQQITSLWACKQTLLCWQEQIVSTKMKQKIVFLVD